MADNIGMVQVLTAQEVMDRQLEEVESQAQKKDAIISSLSQYVDLRWADAKKAKEPIEDQMMDSLRQRDGEYDPKKLAEITSAEQPPIFMNITSTKCRNASAWIRDIVFQTSGRIFGVEPTPVPELPPQIMQQIQNVVMKQFVQMAINDVQQTGQSLPPQVISQLIAEHAKEIADTVYKKAQDMAKELSLKIEDRIDDDWVQHGFYVALNDVIDDIVTLKAGLIKGPIFRKEKVKVTVMDQSGKISREVKEVIIPAYERRSPFCIYPSPRSVDIDNGYIFDVISIRPRHLYELIGVEGYNEKEIRDVLREFNSKELNNKWLALSDSARIGMGDTRIDDSTDEYPEENIYCLELWDEIPGRLLKEWGLKDIEDDDAEYSCCVWKIGNHIIKAMLNYDSLGRKPISKTSFQPANDSFWGHGIPELIADCQQVCNACARSILSNIGMGALPQIGLNVDRLEPNASRKFLPGKIWPFTDEQMASNVPPITFYQPVMVTEKLMNVYSAFSKIADEHSGVPAYAHGDSQVGGAGSTSSGLSMLIAQASRGIKNVIRSIDADIISPRAEYHYDYLLDNYEIYGLLGDYQVKARGSEALIAKEQQVTRKIEYLQNTANPVDIQLVGPENRKKMLFDVAKFLGINLDESAPLPQPQPNVGQVPPEKPQTLDNAGNPAQGVDNRQFNPERPRLPVGGGAE
jgi:hypothetical protein